MSGAVYDLAAHTLTQSNKKIAPETEALQYVDFGSEDFAIHVQKMDFFCGNVD